MVIISQYFFLFFFFLLPIVTQCDDVQVLNPFPSSSSSSSPIQLHKKEEENRKQSQHPAYQKQQQHQQPSPPPVNLHQEEDHTVPTTDLASTSRELQSHHPVNRSDVKLSIDSQKPNCYQDEAVHVIIRYTFYHLDPILYEHHLLITLRNFNFQPLIEYQPYLMDEINLLQVPISQFQLGGEKVYLQLYDNTTQKILDEQTLRFVNPCFIRPSFFQQYIWIPLIDNPLVVGFGAVALTGKIFANQFFGNAAAAAAGALGGVVFPQLPNLQYGDNAFYQGRTGNGKDESAFVFMKRYLDRLTDRVNPPVPITLPLPKVITPPPNSFSQSSAQVPMPEVTTVTTLAPANPPAATTTTYGLQAPVASLTSRYLFQAITLIGGLAFFLSQSLRLFDTQPIRTRPINPAPFSTFTPLETPPPLTTRTKAKPFSFWRDINSFLKTLTHSDRDHWKRFRGNFPIPTSEQLEQFQKNPKVIVTKKMWKTILATLLQTGLYFLKKWRLNNSSPHFFQHTGANDLPF